MLTTSTLHELIITDKKFDDYTTRRVSIKPMLDDLYSTEVCPRCNGAGRKIDPAKLKSLALKSNIPFKDIAASMRISPQFLTDLLNDRRDWTTSKITSFIQAIGANTTDEG